MTPNGDPERVLNRSAARLAGAVCAFLALLGAAALMVLVIAWRGKDVQLLAYLSGWVVLLALMAVAAVQLSRGNASAQRLLLVFWLLVAVAAGLAALAGQLWGGGGGRCPCRCGQWRGRCWGGLWWPWRWW